MNRTLRVSPASFRRLSGIVFLTAVLAPATAFGQAAGAPATDDKDIYDYEQTTGPVGAQPSYPGLPRGNGTKLETDIGPMKARFYGTILLNTSISTAEVIGQEVPLWAAGARRSGHLSGWHVGRASNNHDLIFTMRQSILGFTLNPAKRSDTGLESLGPGGDGFLRLADAGYVSRRKIACSTSLACDGLFPARSTKN